MQQSLTIMTESEGRLHEIAKRMAFALPASRMRDYERPLTIVLTGGFDVGKSIFADVIRQNLMDMATCLREDPGYRELWTGKRKGLDFQVAFMNAVYNEEGLVDFLSKRDRGGINFVQNLSPEILRYLKYDVHINIDVDRINIGPKKPVAAFNAQADLRDLSGRVVRFEVFDESLLQSKAFKRFWNFLGRETKPPAAPPAPIPL